MMNGYKRDTEAVEHEMLVGEHSECAEAASRGAVERSEKQM